MSEVARNPEARAVIGRRRRSLFMLGGAFVLAAVGVLAVLTLISPATFGRAMGLATEVPATITAVRLASEQPDNRDAQPRWDVSLAWTDPTDRTPRTGTATVNAAAGTYRPGQPGGPSNSCSRFTEPGTPTGPAFAAETRRHALVMNKQER